jgi:hypothetical protein
MGRKPKPPGIFRYFFGWVVIIFFLFPMMWLITTEKSHSLFRKTAASLFMYLVDGLIWIQQKHRVGHSC